jgi:cobalt/nickel transport system permease protein
VSAFCNQAIELTGLAGDRGSPVHRLDPRAKLVGVLGITLVAVSTPLAAWPAWVACALALAAVAAAARVGPGVLWRRARLILPPVLFVAAFLPFVRSGESVEVGPVSLSADGLETLASVSAKATIGVVGAVLLGATTTFPSVLQALESLRVPRLFTLIAAFTYRYLFVVLEEVQRMRAALSSRGYRPRHALQATAIGRVATALFLRSYARGERVYLAMLARGYTGTMPRGESLSFRAVDVAFLGLLAAALLPVRVVAGMS